MVAVSAISSRRYFHVIVTVEVLKKINGSLVSGQAFTVGDMARECALDEAILKAVEKDLSRPLESVNAFFQLMASYLSEMQKRVKIMSECYTAIQKLQIKHAVISTSAERQFPPIVWENESS